jgi:hypothetical protein
MPVRRKPDGTFEFDSVAEAVAFEQQVAVRVTPMAPRSQPKPRSNKPVRQPTAATPASDADDATRALAILIHGGSKGLLGKDVASKLGMKNPKGLSGTAQAIRKRISEVANGTPLEKLFWIERKPRLPTRWMVDAQKLRELGLAE